MQTKNSIDAHWDAISRNILDEEFINENALNLNWTLVLKNNSLSDVTLENNFDHLDFEMVSSYQSLGTEFLEKHLSQLNSYRLIRNKNIPDQFFFDHLDRFNLSELLEGRKLTKKTLQDNWHLIRNSNTLNTNIINDYMSTMPKRVQYISIVIAITTIIVAFLLTSALLSLTWLLLSKILEMHNIIFVKINTTETLSIMFLLTFPVLIIYVVFMDSFNNSLIMLIDKLFLFLSGKSGKFDYFVSVKRLLSRAKIYKEGLTHENIKNPSN